MYAPIPRGLALVAGAIALLIVLPATARAALIDRQTLLDWGTGAYDQTLLTLGIPGTMDFAETANLNGSRSGVGGRAFVWPMSTQFRVQNSLVRLDPVTYTPVLRRFADQLYSRYWSTVNGRGGYRSSVNFGSDRYYDDNAHLAVALAEAYQLTGDPVC